MNFTSRLKRLEEPVIEDWKRSWNAFHRRCYDRLSFEELSALCDSFELSPEGEDRTDAIIQAWWDRTACTEEITDWCTWSDSIDEFYGHGAGRLDISRWPYDLPMPPAEPPGLWELAQEGVNAEDSLAQYAGGRLLYHLSQARTIRDEYSNANSEA